MKKGTLQSLCIRFCESNAILVPHKRVLIVDQSREIADKCRNLLERERFEVEIALSAEVAFNILEERAMNLVIIDIDLGEKDGIEVVKQIRRVYQQLPIIVVHDRDPEKVEDDLFLVNNVRFLKKPVEFEDIFDQICEFIPEP